MPSIDSQTTRLPMANRRFFHVSVNGFQLIARFGATAGVNSADIAAYRRRVLARENLEKLRDFVTDLQLVEGTRGLISLFSARQAPAPGKLPAALPYILGGLRIAGGLSLIGAVVAEIAAGTAGAGSGLRLKWNFCRFGGHSAYLSLCSRICDIALQH